MPTWTGKRSIIVVTAYKDQGREQFVRTEVEVTQDEYHEGVHFKLVEESLKGRGLEGPYAHYDPFDAPRFLLEALKESVAQATKLPETVANSTPQEP